jgi:hypothetical protein
MSGSRLPDTDIWQLVLEDALLNVHRHVVIGARDEFPAAFEEIRARFRIDTDVPAGLLGGSMGAAATLGSRPLYGHDHGPLAAAFP